MMITIRTELARRLYDLLVKTFNGPMTFNEARAAAGLKPFVSNKCIKVLVADEDTVITFEESFIISAVEIIIATIAELGAWIPLITLTGRRLKKIWAEFMEEWEINFPEV